MKRKLERVPNHPGIARILVFDPKSGKWKEPKRGSKFRATRQEVADGISKKVPGFFATFAEAKAFRCRTEPEPETPRLATEMTFGQLAERWLVDWLPNKDVSTQVRYKSYLKHFKFFWENPVEKIEPNHIDRWIGIIKQPSYLAQGHSTRVTYHHEFSVLRVILNFYASRFNRNYRLPFIADHKKMLKVKDKSLVKKDLTVRDFQSFITALEEICREADCEAIYYLALMQYATYSRVQEAAALHYEDFDFERSKLIMNKKVQWLRAKGFEDRIVGGAKTNGGKELEMPALAAQVFRQWVLKSGIRSGLLFRDRDGQHLTYRQIESRYSQALSRARLPFRATHILRHAALCEHYDTCKDLLATQQVAGQRDLRSTTRYAKIRDDRLVKVQKEMDQKLAGLMKFK
jgi:integrase